MARYNLKRYQIGDDILIPFHNSKENGQPQADRMCLIEEPNLRPMGFVKDISKKPIQDFAGSPHGFLCIVVCANCEEAFDYLYDPQEHKLTRIYSNKER